MWDQARRIRLVRRNPHGEFEEIDRGVNFFVERLEAWGCRPEWSCEGHSDGFYIVFSGTYKAALFISSMGGFNIEIMGYERWRLFINEPTTERQKRKLLRKMAEIWASTEKENSDG